MRMLHEGILDAICDRSPQTTNEPRSGPEPSGSAPAASAMLTTLWTAACVTGTNSIAPVRGGHADSRTIDRIAVITCIGIKTRTGIKVMPRH